MPAGPALPGLLLVFAAMVLLIFVSVSAPTWDKISFLNVGSVGAQQMRYGVFGFTGSGRSIGYDFSDPRANTTVMHNLTKTLILHPIAAGLSGLAFLFGLCGASYHRAGTILMTLLAGLATLATLLAWVIDMVLFGITRNRYRGDNIPAQYGNANWLTLGALVALMLGFCASACGVFGRYRRRREPTPTY
ncbi:pali-domain-containing protein [Crucibulum laeve]|uniref:Pali-domain-containing protein n=1 Tax=Crucibulum laeve TaxID=68775 RepID=A0A5C3MH06_9AGAR|nr:pali-domain-containing protein [Crucibulum laeve]